MINLTLVLKPFFKEKRRVRSLNYYIILKQGYMGKWGNKQTGLLKIQFDSLPFSPLHMYWNSKDKIALLAVESRHLQIWLKDEYETKLQSWGVYIWHNERKIDLFAYWHGAHPLRGCSERRTTPICG